MGFQTRRTVNLLGGKVARAIEGQEVVALDKDHLFERFAALQGSKDTLEQGTEGLGLDRVEYLTHRRITGNPLDAVDLLQIPLGSVFVKGQKRGRFQGKHGKGGHKRIA